MNALQNETVATLTRLSEVVARYTHANKTSTREHITFSKEEAFLLWRHYSELHTRMALETEKFGSAIITAVAEDMRYTQGLYYAYLDKERV